MKMAMLTVYFDRNITLNNCWLHISMLKGSLDEKTLDFTWKTKLILLRETNKVPETTVPSNLCVLTQVRHFDAKRKLDTLMLDTK